MKIGFVLDDGFDRLDGVQQYMLTNGEWLNKQGHEIHYLVGETARDDIPNLHSLSKNLKVRFNKNRVSIPVRVYKKRILKLLSNEKFDVLHIQMPFSPMLSGYVVRNAPKHTAVVGTFHIAPYGKPEQYINRVFALFLRNTLKRFDRVVSVSSVAQDFANNTFKIESVIIPCAIDITKYETKIIETSIQTVVFLGRLVERKGAMQFLRAIKQLTPGEDIKILIGGKGPLEKELKDFANKNNLNVRFSGFIEEIDKPRFLSKADIAVFPSLGGESFGIVLIEAMAAGAGVVLAGNNPGYREVMSNNDNFLVDANNEDEFARRLKKLLDDEQYRKKLHSVQEELVRQYDISVTGPKLLEIYIQALHSRVSLR